MGVRVEEARPTISSEGAAKTEVAAARAAMAEKVFILEVGNRRCEDINI
jgi:hypothetical protein